MLPCVLILISVPFVCGSGGSPAPPSQDPREQLERLTIEELLQQLPELEGRMARSVLLERGEPARESLVVALRTGRLAGSVEGRVSAYWVLAKLPIGEPITDPHQVELLLQGLVDPSRYVRLAAAEGVLRLPEAAQRQAVPALRAWLEGGDHSLHAEAARIGAGNVGVGALVLDRISAVLFATDPVREAWGAFEEENTPELTMVRGSARWRSSQVHARTRAAIAWIKVTGLVEPEGGWKGLDADGWEALTRAVTHVVAEASIEHFEKSYPAVSLELVKASGGKFVELAGELVFRQDTSVSVRREVLKPFLETVTGYVLDEGARRKYLDLLARVRASSLPLEIRSPAEAIQRVLEAQGH